MKTNEILRKGASDALKWESTIAISTIIVISNDGVITLSDAVENDIKKAQAENSAKNIA